MNSKKVKKLRRRCEALWSGPLAGFLKGRYGVAGFKLFFSHAKEDCKSGNMGFIEAMERDAAARLAAAEEEAEK